MTLEEREHDVQEIRDKLTAMDKILQERGITYDKYATPQEKEQSIQKWTDAFSAFRKHARLKVNSLKEDEVGMGILYQSIYNQLQSRANKKDAAQLFTSKKITTLLAKRYNSNIRTTARNMAQYAGYKSIVTWLDFSYRIAAKELLQWGSSIIEYENYAQQVIRYIGIYETAKGDKDEINKLHELLQVSQLDIMENKGIFSTVVRYQIGNILHCRKAIAAYNTALGLVALQVGEPQLYYAYSLKAIHIKDSTESATNYFNEVRKRTANATYLPEEYKNFILDDLFTKQVTPWPLDPIADEYKPLSINSPCLQWAKQQLQDGLFTCDTEQYKLQQILIQNRADWVDESELAHG